MFRLGVREEGGGGVGSADVLECSEGVFEKLESNVKRTGPGFRREREGRGEIIIIMC